MPLAEGYISPEIALLHNDVIVYHTYKDGYSAQQLSYHFTLNEEEDPDDEFDVRDLKTWKGDGDSAIDRALRAAIDSRELKYN